MVLFQASHSLPSRDFRVLNWRLADARCERKKRRSRRRRGNTGKNKKEREGERGRKREKERKLWTLFLLTVLHGSRNNILVPGTKLQFNTAYYAGIC